MKTCNRRMVIANNKLSNELDKRSKSNELCTRKLVFAILSKTAEMHPQNLFEKPITPTAEKVTFISNKEFGPDALTKSDFDDLLDVSNRISSSFDDRHAFLNEWLSKLSTFAEFHDTNVNTTTFAEAKVDERKRSTVKLPFQPYNCAFKEDSINHLQTENPKVETSKLDDLHSTLESLFFYGEDLFNDNGRSEYLLSALPRET